MGQVIGGRFEIRDLLGQGGMGSVYLGVDMPTGQQVAIKLLRPEVVAANPGLVERFAREGEALRRLNHPNIVKMLDTVEDGGQHYLVMEYVGAGSLADALASGSTPLSVEAVLHIALELADALTRAHHLKIIHRDLKPANVLLADDGTPRLTDFGIAQLDDQRRVTESGVVVGTISYLSPEACQERPLDARTDIWAFGVLLYEILTGRRPFDRDNMAATLTAILTEPPPDLHALRRDIPPALATLINRMLEKDRDKRIASARQVGAELEAILRGDTTPVAVGSTPPNAQRQSKSEPRLDLDGSTTITPTPPMISPMPMRQRFPLFVAALLLLVGLLGLPLLMTRITGIGSAATPTPESARIAPVADDEYMVLVAQLEPVQTEPRDATRFIIDDLRQQLEVEAPLSNVRIRQYPNVITNDSDAIAAAETVGASVIVWGNYTRDEITLNVQVGSTAAFPYNQFERDILERTANVRVEMADETRQSIAPEVLGVMALLFIADGDTWGFGQMLVPLESITVERAELSGDSIAAYVHRYLATYSTDTAQAIEEMDRAIDSDANNAILYALRSQAMVRLIYNQPENLARFTFEPDLSMFEPANRDAETAARLGPDQWAVPFDVTYWGTYPNALRNYTEIIERRPDDGFYYFVRATFYYLERQFELARSDVDQAIALEPDLGFAHGLAVMLALRDGRFSDAAALSDQLITTTPPEPAYLLRLNKAIIGADFEVPVGRAFPVLNKLILGQDEDALEIIYEYTTTGMETDDDYLLLTGLAQCRLGNTREAHVAFSFVTMTIYRTPIANLFDAEVLLRQGNRPEALDQFALIQQSDLADQLAPFSAALLHHDFGCVDLFDSARIAQVMEEYGDLTSDDVAVMLAASTSPAIPSPAAATLP